MKKIPLNELVRKVGSFGDATLIGIGPMSSNVVESCFELAKLYRFPLMFIASRNQIDKKELGGGYVNGWDQFDFVNAIEKIAQKNSFYDYYVCRDHGGPWQRDEERNAHLELDQAMKIAKESFISDIEAGFDLIMVDPTKDPFTMGKVVDLDFVLEKTVELIEFCEQERKRRKIGVIAYEVGTEETNGGLTQVETYNVFLEKLNKELKRRGLPTPLFAVGQTGTLVKSTRQAGIFNYQNAKILTDMAKTHGVYLKEHNADYLDSASLALHIPAGITAVNVAPQFGYVETKSYLSLCMIEDELLKNGAIASKSNLYAVLLENAIKIGRWKKWVSEEDGLKSYGEILEDKKLAREILEIAGHYVLDVDVVKNEVGKLFANLNSCNIDGKEFVKDHIKASIMEYITCFNMKYILDRL
ncbi:class II D-tagatose-bisphosphate aldolase, non-catalytic subunit [Candidatus Saccharibacteria bacterium]|nr:class II D-tagatose-bisphosphate aldolase, non-catalytic subunit [Candidatus Saccharibacteria bacterium]